MNRSLQDLVDLLDLETLEVNLFRGTSRDLGGRSVFGGQVIGQGLVAASRTVESGDVHSLHAYFLRPGDMEAAIVYEVDRIRDGRSFTTRRVLAIQHGQPILSMMASFQKREPGFEHQTPMPEVPAPETLPTRVELGRRSLARQAERGRTVPERVRHIFESEVAIEIRPIDPVDPFDPGARPPAQAFWFKAAGKLPDDPMLHRCVLAYASDFNLLSTALLPHGVTWFSPDVIVASIDHALWFHRDPRVDDWLLYSMDTPTAQGSRGLARGSIYDRGGRLVASTAQEGLMRHVEAAPGSPGRTTR